jgi:hypothetical protein
MGAGVSFTCEPPDAVAKISYPVVPEGQVHRMRTLFGVGETRTSDGGGPAGGVVLSRTAVVVGLANVT